MVPSRHSPTPTCIVDMYLRKEAVLSSQIAGTQSALQDVLASEAKVLICDVIPLTCASSFNYVDARNDGLELLTSLPLSHRLIREIHKRLLHGVLAAQLQPGELRTSQNWIGPQCCTINEAVFVQPPPTQVMGSQRQLRVISPRAGRHPSHNTSSGTVACPVRDRSTLFSMATGELGD